ncbi:MAG: hypothetical protein ACI9MR_001991 [Myxococcota bacterium]|jgi:hypothetical protein
MSNLGWSPAVSLALKEERIAKRLKRTDKLFLSLRKHRHELFDEQFQGELARLSRRADGRPYRQRYWR